MKVVKNTVEVINEIQKVNSTGFTPYKASRKSNIKQFLNVFVNTTPKLSNPSS